MTSLVSTAFTPSMSQGTPTGSFTAPETVQGLPDDPLTLLTPEERGTMTAQETKDLREYINSEQFQSLLEDQGFPDEDPHEEPKSDRGYTREYLLNEQAAYVAGTVALAFTACKAASMAKDKAIAIHEHFADALRAERRAKNKARTEGGGTEVITERPLGLRAFVATGERLNTTSKVLKRGAAGVKDWFSTGNSTLGQSSVEQTSTDAGSTGD